MRSGRVPLVCRLDVMMTENDSIVITGCGWVTPFAIGNTDKILSAAGCATTSQQADHAELYGTVSESELDRRLQASKELRGDKTAWMAAVAWDAAFEDASLDASSIDGDRLGLVMGCSLAGQQSMINFANDVRQQSARFVSPIHFPHTVGNYAAGALARAKGIRGPNVTLACGSQTSLRAVIEGCMLLGDGAADVIVCGGCDALSRETAPAVLQPGDKPNECACFVTLERLDHAQQRNARILAGAWGLNGDSGRSGSKGASPNYLTASVTSPADGDITVEPWLGCCGGALGAATVAVAIVAGHGVALRDIPGTGAALSVTETTAGECSPASRVLIRDNGLEPTMSLLLDVQRDKQKP